MAESIASLRRVLMTGSITWNSKKYNENIEKEYQKLLETLSPEQEEVLTKYCDEIFASGAETEEFFYRLGIKDGLRLKSTVKSVLEMMARNRNL